MGRRNRSGSADRNRRRSPFEHVGRFDPSRLEASLHTTHTSIPREAEIPAQQPPPKEPPKVPAQRQRKVQRAEKQRKVERRPGAIAKAIGRPILNTEIMEQSRQLFQARHDIRSWAPSETPFVTYILDGTLKHCMGNISIEDALESFVNSSAYDGSISEENARATATWIRVNNRDRRFIERHVILDDQLWQDELVPLRTHLNWRATGRDVDHPLAIPIGKMIMPRKLGNLADFSPLRRSIEQDEKANPNIAVLELGPLQILWQDVSTSPERPSP